jgi:hypothetical protein
MDWGSGYGRHRFRHGVPAAHQWHQAIVQPQDISSVSAITFFFQIMGAAIFVSAGQAAFGNRLLAGVTAERLGADPSSLLSIGADALRNNYGGDTLRYVIDAYMRGLRPTLRYALRWQHCLSSLRCCRGGKRFGRTRDARMPSLATHSRLN